MRRGSSILTWSALMQGSVVRFSFRLEALYLVRGLVHWQVLQVMLVYEFRLKTLSLPLCKYLRQVTPGGIKKVSGHGGNSVVWQYKRTEHLHMHMEALKWTLNYDKQQAGELILAANNWPNTATSKFSKCSYHTLRMSFMYIVPDQVKTLDFDWMDLPLAVAQKKKNPTTLALGDENKIHNSHRILKILPDPALPQGG